MSAVRKLAGQTAIYGLPSIIGRVLNYFLVPLHTYRFTEAEYGVVSEFYAYVAFFVVVLMFGMETTFFRFVQQAEDKEKAFNQAFSFVLVVNVAFLLVAFVFAQSIADWMHHPEYRNYVIWFACILAMDATSSILLAKLRYLEQPVRFAAIQFAGIGVNILLNLIFLLVLFDTYPEFGIGFIFLANLFSSLIRPLLLYKELSTYRFIWDKVMAKAMLIFAFPLVIAGFAGIINETLDRILLKRILLPEHGLEYAEAQLGIYSANYKLSILVTLFIQAFRFAAEPFFFSQEANADKDKVYSKIMTWFVIVVSLMFLVISTNLEIFKWFTPKEAYWEGLKVVPILLLANIFLGIYYNQSIWYKLANKTVYGAYIAVGGAAITIGLNFALIPMIGYLGAAITTLVVYFSMSVASWYFGQKIYPIKYNLRKIALYLVLSLILFFISRLISPESVMTSAFLSLFLILIFTGVVFFIEQPLKTLKKKEID